MYAVKLLKEVFEITFLITIKIYSYFCLMRWHSGFMRSTNTVETCLLYGI